ncbi:MAG TPA: ATP-binding protein [Deltaproteobacteria bacterium]|jgi:signal transduction histidine kinase|nr:ATP-binding protein [Deltaproteobacteria bacterium]HOI06282.1 ATP-binding protein [Deltaproteobacteria bacterium]
MKTSGITGNGKSKAVEKPAEVQKMRDGLMETIAQAEKTIERLHKAESRKSIDPHILEEIAHALKERVKELNCLYSISSIVEKHGFDLDIIMERTAEIIPSAWQYPEITCCRISLGDRVIQSPDFRETPWRLAQSILVDGRIEGSLEVFYLEEMPPMGEGPFLLEERSLINVIAERIGKIAERKEADDALRRSESKTMALLNAIPDLMFQVDGNGTLTGLHTGSFTMLRGLEERFVGRNIYCLADEEDLLPRRFIDHTLSSVRRTLETGNPQAFEQHTSIRGRGSDYEVRMVVCGPDEVLGIVRDVTRRKRLEREILEISNREQRRIGQDLHDSLCQHLAGIGFMGKVLEKKVSTSMPVDVEDVREIVDLIDQAITLTKGYARGLNPVELQAEGLMVALTKLAENVRRLFGVTCTFSCEPPIFIHDNEMATHLYRIVQEAINNAIKHGKADTITIRLEKKEGGGLLTVSDNGLGVRKGASKGKGMGLSIMRYRASMFGATLDIRSQENAGTDIVCSFGL